MRRPRLLLLIFCLFIGLNLAVGVEAAVRPLSLHPSCDASQLPSGYTSASDQDALCLQQCRQLCPLDAVDGQRWYCDESPSNLPTCVYNSVWWSMALSGSKCNIQCTTVSSTGQNPGSSNALSSSQAQAENDRLRQISNNQARGDGRINLIQPIQGASRVTGIAQYIALWYRYLIGISVIAAIVMVVWGGFLYLVGSTTGSVKAGKEHIKDALIGLVLVFGAYLILNTFNPDLVVLREPTIQNIRLRQLELQQAASAASTTSSFTYSSTTCVDTECRQRSTAAGRQGVFSCRAAGQACPGQTCECVLNQAATDDSDRAQGGIRRGQL